MQDTRIVQPPNPPTGPAVRIDIPGMPDPTAVWRAAVAQRRELTSQLDRLRDQRNNISEKLQEPMIGGADRKGLEGQIIDVDAQIAAVQKRLAAANERVANTAAVPGAVVDEPRVIYHGPPQAAYALGALFILVTFFPLSVAFARRIWRRGAAAPAALPPDLMDRLTRLDQAVDSIAIEVERIGEGQRFVTRLMGERQAAEPLPARRPS